MDDRGPSGVVVGGAGFRTISMGGAIVGATVGGAIVGVIVGATVGGEIVGGATIAGEVVMVSRLQTKGNNIS